jgi:hypothetical protein
VIGPARDGRGPGPSGTDRADGAASVIQRDSLDRTGPRKLNWHRFRPDADFGPKTHEPKPKQKVHPAFEDIEFDDELFSPR